MSPSERHPRPRPRPRPASCPRPRPSRPAHLEVAEQLGDEGGVEDGEAEVLDVRGCEVLEVVRIVDVVVLQRLQDLVDFVRLDAHAQEQLAQRRLLPHPPVSLTTILSARGRSSNKRQEERREEQRRQERE